MRFPRPKAEGQSFYHCVSRVVDRRFIFQSSGPGSAEAERFVDEEKYFSALLVLSPLTSSLKAFAWLRTRRFTATIPIPTSLSFSFPAYLICPSLYSSNSFSAKESHTIETPTDQAKLSTLTLNTPSRFAD
jgi:hypothetical protein